MGNSNVSTRDTQLEKQRLGYIALSFSNMDNTSEPKIQAGSVVEIAGTLYSVTSEESNSDWGDISNSAQAYLILDPAADGSSFSAKWTSSAPVWSEAKYGWYGDGTNEDADNRYVLRCYKDGSGNYTKKNAYIQTHDHRYLDGDQYGTVGGEVTYTGDNTFSGNNTFSAQQTFSKSITIGEGIRAPNVLHDSGQSDGDLYDFLSPFLPSNGDTVMVNGGMSETVSGVIVRYNPSYAKRVSSTTIEIYAEKIRIYDPGSGQSNTHDIATYSVDEGDTSSSLYVSIAV